MFSEWVYDRDWERFFEGCLAGRSEWEHRHSCMIHSEVFGVMSYMTSKYFYSRERELMNELWLEMAEMLDK